MVARLGGSADADQDVGQRGPDRALAADPAKLLVVPAAAALVALLCDGLPATLRRAAAVGERPEVPRRGGDAA
ncbi:hypothetical protein [Kitasatospora purpeofusca]|uniref:Uncharacterized protein n=1 Tax=Kitasatospora purpeofusca TaxID=67352 RepID=A0ABZ1TRX7_9ACTN|nr:hypothetical protein [Kitasatospora purpeofusca]